MNGDDTILDLLRAGPPEEDTYRPPSLCGPSLVNAGTVITGRVTFKRAPDAPRRAPERRMTWYAAAVAAVAIAFGAIVVSISLGLPFGLGAMNSTLSSPSRAVSPSAAVTPPPSGRGQSPGLTTLPPAFTGASGASFDPDGSAYLLGQIGNQWAIDAIGPTGRELPGWPVTVPIGGVPSLTVVPGQGVLVAGAVAVAWIDRTGTTRPGWPVQLGLDVFGAWISPRGDVLVAVVSALGDTQISAYDAAGRRQPGWPRSLAGKIGGSVVFGTDGGTYVATDTGAVSRIYRLGLDGTISPGWPITGWPSFVGDPTGGLAVWSYTGPGGHPVEWTYAGTVARTSVARVGTDGRPRAGWPVSIAGPASAPALGADGTVYLSRGDGEAATGGSLLALSPGGRALPGWAVDLGGMGLPTAKSLYQPAVTVPPIVRPDGVVEVQVVAGSGAEIVGLEPSGASAPGFPVALGPGSRFGGFVHGVPGGSVAALLITPAGTTVALESDGTVYRVTAVDKAGRSLPGWPVVLRALDTPQAWSLSASGTLTVETDDEVVQPAVGRIYRFQTGP